MTPPTSPPIVIPPTFTLVEQAPIATSHAPKRGLRLAAIVLAAAGWWLSFDLQLLSEGEGATNPLLSAVCRSDAASDCLSVLRSSAARFGAGVDARGRVTVGFPWAAIGMAYFAFVGLWYLLVGPPTPGRRLWHLPIIIVVVLGVWSSVGLILTMAFELHRWCIGCTTVHIVNGILLLLTLLAFPWRAAPRYAAPNPTFAHGSAALCACLAVFAGHMLYTQLIAVGNGARQLQDAYTRIMDDPAFIRWNYSRQPVVSLPLRDDEAFLGTDSAENTVVAFVDFQCPACRQLAQMLARLNADHPGRLRHTLRHFPHDPACNPAITTAGHPAACRAAQAAEAARSVGGNAAFLKMRNWLYDHQAELDGEHFSEWAAALGLDRAKFDAALNDPAVMQRIRQDIELGVSAGVREVPVVFLNGRRVEGWRNQAGWRTLLGVPEPASAPATRPADPGTLAP